MRIHHLDTATMCPLGRRFVNGSGGVLERGTMVCHCLLIETDAGLVLVDTGISRADCAAPWSRLGPTFVVGVAPRLDASQCAITQVERLGFSATDVRHIVLTHLDLDHAGGLPDFPKAKVHVLADEHAAAMARATMNERARYKPCQWAHQPDFVLHRADGERWRGFDAVRTIPGLPPEIFIVPLSGHTRGHACIGVDLGDRALLHCGDAYFHRAAVRGGAMPLGLDLFERFMAIDGRAVATNHQRLAELARDPTVRVFSAHDPEELEEAREDQRRVEA